MKLLSRIFGIASLPIFAMTMTACGDMNLGQSIQVKLDPATQSAKLEVELTNGLQVSMTGEYAIQENWGKIYFVNPTQTTNGKIGVEVSLAAVIGHELNFSTLTTLPNGAPLPVAITPPLLGIPVMHDNNFDLKAALSLTPDLQVGAVVGIKAFSSKYVIPGVAICQNFRNAAQEAFAAICIYGPSASGTDFGGVFLAGNFGDVIPSNLLNASAPQTLALASRSAMYSMSAAPEAPMLNLSPLDLSSSKFEQAIFDPKKKIMTSEGQKSLRNVQKILKVR